MPLYVTETTALLQILSADLPIRATVYLLAFDGVIASRGGIPMSEKGAIIGAIGVSGGTDSQDEIVSKAGAAVIDELQAESN
jgi:uncharacterized protein GlcG (DUF336 family)